MAFGLLVLVALPRLAYIASVATIGLLVVGGLFIGGLAVTGVRLPLGTGLTAAAGGALALGYVAIAGTVALGPPSLRPWSGREAADGAHQVSVRVRIAPSPTGPLHIGTARTSLFNYLFAKNQGGTFILRLEDTDVARSTLDYERDILDGLHWLGIEWDEGPEVAGLPARGPYGPYRQMQRLDRYRAAADRLLAEDKAYYCYCSPEELAADRRLRKAQQAPHYVGRCAHPRRASERAAARPRAASRSFASASGTGVVAFDDIIRGHVEIDTTALGGDLDHRPQRRHAAVPLHRRRRRCRDGSSATSFAARTTCPTRPSTSCSSAPSAPMCPQFAHLPLILNPDRTKMSKRKSQTAVADYRAGLHPEGFVNFLALLGWASGGEEEIFSLAELGQLFSLERVHRAARCSIVSGSNGSTGSGSASCPTRSWSSECCPSSCTTCACSRKVARRSRFRGAEELRPLIPMIRERMPTLAAAGPLLDFLFVTDLPSSPRCSSPSAGMRPRRWPA